MAGIIPASIAHIPKLTYLYLNHNQFSGRIPDAFYKHPFLKEMYIEGNAFRPGVNPIGVHKVLELSDSDFLFYITYTNYLVITISQRVITFFRRSKAILLVP